MFVVTTPDLLYLGGKVFLKAGRIRKSRPEDAQNNIAPAACRRARAICLHHPFTFQALQQEIATHHYSGEFCHVSPLSICWRTRAATDVLPGRGQAPPIPCPI